MTVYRCCVAALATAGGESSRATVTIRSRDGTLEFEVALAGARVSPGTLDPLAARVDALGGSLEVAPARVAGRLPVTS